MRRAPEPWLIERWIVSYDGSIWHPRATRQEVWHLLADRWNERYAEEGDEDFPVLLLNYDANIEADGPDLEQLCRWFRGQFDQVSVEMHEIRLEIAEVQALAADEEAFQAWRAQGLHVEDLRAPELLDVTQMYPEDHPEPQPGRIYPHGFLEGPDPDGAFWVTISNHGYTDTVLERVERYLWEHHARPEGFYSSEAK